MDSVDKSKKKEGGVAITTKEACPREKLGVVKRKDRRGQEKGNRRRG